MWSSSKAEIGRSALTEIWLRSPPWYSQNASHGRSCTTSRSTPSPSGSSTIPRVHERASSIRPATVCSIRSGGTVIDFRQLS